MNEVRLKQDCQKNSLARHWLHSKLRCAYGKAYFLSLLHNHPSRSIENISFYIVPIQKPIQTPVSKYMHVFCSMDVKYNNLTPMEVRIWWQLFLRRHILWQKSWVRCLSSYIGTYLSDGFCNWPYLDKECMNFCLKAHTFQFPPQTEFFKPIMR